MRIFLATLFLSFLSQSFASDVIVIAHAEGQFYPHEYTSQGKLQGLHIEIINQTAAALDLTVQYEALPWKRAIKALERGDVDGLSYIAKTDERMQFAYFEAGNILSEARFWPVILRKNRNKIHFNGSLMSLQDYRIAVGPGYKYGEPFDSATYLDKVVIESPQSILLANLLRLNRIDVVIYDIRILRAELSNEYVDQYFYSFEQSISENQYYLAFSKRKRSKQFAVAFAKAASVFKFTPYYQQQLKQYDVVGQNNIVIAPPES